MVLQTLSLIEVKCIHMKVWKRWNAETTHRDKTDREHKHNNMWQTKSE